jgi:hypothetical protein
MYEVVKKAAHSRAKRPRSRKAPRHPSGVEPIEPVELVGLSPWVAGRRMVRVWGLAGIDSRAGLYRCIGGHRTGEANGGVGRNEEEERRTGTAAGAKHTKGTAEGGGLIRESNE